jgi:23S rRNA pseudouridine1911/1915/1917 synthase
MDPREFFEVLYEDNHLLIVNKKAGVLVQGDATGDTPLVEAGKLYIKEKYKKPGDVFLGVVHRLALERMNALFRDRETQKTYWAIVTSRPPNPTGTLIHWLEKDEQKNKTTAYSREKPGALRSELRYSILSEGQSGYLLEVNPVTGRPHQIRVQLASMGCVIRGDIKYGDRMANDDGSICLHARQLEFIHPVKKEKLIVKATIPRHGWWTKFAHLD